MEIKITKPVPEDALGLTTVLYKAWLVTYPNEELGITVDDIEDSYKDHFTDEAIKKYQHRLANPDANRLGLVAKDGQQVVGVTALVRNEENNQLKTIYVHPEYFRKGIGMMLWNEVKKFCDPAKDTIVEVATYNSRAVEFYKKLGFVDTGKRFTDERFRMKSGAALPEMEMVLKRAQ